MVNAKPIDVARAKELLDYRPETGEFVWKVNRTCKAHAGDIAGRVGKRHGYRQIQIDGLLYMAHRLAYAFANDDPAPEIEVDHRNGNRDDNRIENLRAGHNKLNKQNQHVLNRRNTSGFRGVAYIADRNRYAAVLGLNGKTKHLGHYRTIEEAAAARLAGERLHYPFAQSNLNRSTIEVTF